MRQGSHCIVLTRLELRKIHLPLPPKCWNYRGVTTCWVLCSKGGAKEPVTSTNPSPTRDTLPSPRQLLNASLMSRQGSGFGSHSAGGWPCQGLVLVKFGCQITWPFSKALCVFALGTSAAGDVVRLSLAPYTYKTSRVCKSTSAPCTSHVLQELCEQILSK